MLSQWIKDGRATYCEVCLRKKKMQGRDPGCDKCRDRMPDILLENEQIWELVSLGSGQIRVGAESVIGFDYGILMKMAQAIGIRIDRGFFRKIKAVESVVFKKEKKKQWQKPSK